MNTIETIYERHSCRRFCKNQIIDREIVRNILQVGIQAPSGKNIQPWRFIVVDDGKLIADIGALCVYSRFICDAASLIFVCMDTETSYDYKKDAMAIGACMQNMLLVACEHQLGSCWIGEILDREDDVRKIINIPPDRELMAVLALGIENIGATSRMKKTGRIDLNQKIDFWYSLEKESGVS